MKKSIIQTYNADCLTILRDLPDASANVFYLDPPYLYLKNQELERQFNEVELFAQIARILKPKGWVICFGRGDSFCRWNLEMAKNGLEFKEEIVWNKRQNSNPFHNFSRIHELVTIRCKGEASVQLCRVPYLEGKQYDIASIIQDVNRIKTILNNTNHLDKVLRWLEANQHSDTPVQVNFSEKTTSHSKVTFSTTVATCSREERTLQGIIFGLKEKSVIRTPPLEDLFEAQSDIIEENREHYDTIHSTQKPPRLIERLFALVIPKGQTDITVIDPFAGSMGCGKVCKDLNYNYIGCEIHPQYYQIAKESLDKHQPNPPTQTLF